MISTSNSLPPVLAVSGAKDSSAFDVDAQYSRNYLTSMNKKLKVHGRKYKKNDEVYLAEDFDMHPNTKKRKFDSFFYEMSL